MPFSVENGEAKSDANAYADVALYKEFADERGITIPNDDKDIERGLVRATDWIDANYASLFIGARLTTTQALEWPRGGIAVHGTIDPLGYMAPQVRKATCVLAVEAIAGKLWNNNAPQGDKDSRIIEDSIGPLIKKYSPVAPNVAVMQKQFDEVRQILLPVVRGLGYLTVERG